MSPAGTWRPASEYTPGMGRVVVWLSWTEYDRGLARPERGGTFETAYQVIVTDEKPCWVAASDGRPIEITARKVTHFMHPLKPQELL